MTIKIRRIYNIFNWKTLIHLALIAAIALCLFHREYTSDYILYFVALALACTALVRTAYSPKGLNFEGRTLKYQEYRYHRPAYDDIDTDFGKPKFFIGRVHLRSFEVVMEIEKMDFRQNVIEKLFNTGHIRFEGKTGVGNLKTTKKATIYGITKFDTQKEEIERYVNQHKNDAYFEGF